MKYALLLVIVLTKTLAGEGQAELPVYANGLVYSEASIKQLRHIADSLNRKYAHSTLNKRYYSLKQGIANYIELNTGDRSQALKDICNNMSYNAFIEKYNPSIDSNLLITQYERHDDYYKLDLTFYESQIPGQNDAPRICISSNASGQTGGDNGLNGTKGNWIFEYTKAGGYTAEHIRAFYCTQMPASRPLPSTYARLIGYSDWMIDTTTGVYFSDAMTSGPDFRFEDTDLHSKTHEFTQYIKKNTAHLPKKYWHVAPDMPDYRYMDSLAKKYVKDSLSATPAFKQLLSEAAEEALRRKTGITDDLEYYTAQYYSPAVALTLMRSRRVAATCALGAGMIARWRATKIAGLAAALANWQVFLPAQLQMMGDTFDGVAAGKYGSRQQKTYTKEIENIDIDVPDLMLGISLGIANPSGNRPGGSIWTIGGLGRALAETSNRKSVEQKLLSMIEDSRLDDYNRLLMHYLLTDYTYYLQDKQDRIASLQKLVKADESLPTCLLSRIKIDKKAFEN